MGSINTFFHTTLYFEMKAWIVEVSCLMLLLIGGTVGLLVGLNWNELIWYCISETRLVDICLPSR